MGTQNRKTKQIQSLNTAVTHGSLTAATPTSQSTLNIRGKGTQSAENAGKESAGADINGERDVQCKNV